MGSYIDLNKPNTRVWITTLLLVTIDLLFAIAAY
jgi:hypothetical protein